MWETTGDGLFHWRKHYYGLDPDFGKQWFDVKNVLIMDLFFTNMQLLSSQEVNWLEWCGLLVDYCDVFISCLDSHSDGTHSLQMIYWWTSDGMLRFSKSDEETNSSTSWTAWGWVKFQPIVMLGELFLYWWAILQLVCGQGMHASEMG